MAADDWVKEWVKLGSRNNAGDVVQAMKNVGMTNDQIARAIQSYKATLGTPKTVETKPVTVQELVKLIKTPAGLGELQQRLGAMQPEAKESLKKQVQLILQDIEKQKQQDVIKFKTAYGSYMKKAGGQWVLQDKPDQPLPPMTQQKIERDYRTYALAKEKKQQAQAIARPQTPPTTTTRATTQRDTLTGMGASSKYVAENHKKRKKLS
jgi:hypothetical protein